ncbi:recombinase family protein, partial [Neisseriaceae bacterium TC5R-5]|nr:recombinase family protein [Neisseriaceae bacterium TC5R-5]
MFAYCRVSTLEQTTENQRREIEAAGFTIQPQRRIAEHISGSVAASERPGFTVSVQPPHLAPQSILLFTFRKGSNSSIRLFGQVGSFVSVSRN